MSFLEPDQMEAIAKLHNGCILNGGTGSGKSRCALYYYFTKFGGSVEPLFKPMRNPKSLYIITTARKRDTLEWIDEMLPFSLTVTDREKIPYYSIEVKVDSWNNIKKYRKITGAFFIFDEDKVTGSGAWVKAFLDISRKNEWIILSATPGDCWMDYWAVFVANGFYKNKTDFEWQHVVFSPYVKYRMVLRYFNTKILEEHRNDILIPINFNRETMQHHIDISCSYDRTTYRDIARNRWDPFENKPIETAAELCYLQRKVVNSDPSRLNAIIDIWKEKKKVIIFYSYDYELELLRSIKFPCKVKEWNGHVHQMVPEGPEWVYLVNYAAGAEGWNCVSTDTIIFYSMQYSYKIFLQTCGRIDRRNTLYKDLYYYHLKSNAPIDMAISRALRDKKDFNERRYLKW